MQHRILLVDDEPEQLDVLKNFLEIEDYIAITANSSEEAIGILAENGADAIITGDLLPGMPGIELLAIVRLQYPDIVRILLMGHAELDTAIRAINDGQIYRLFTKPCNFVDLAVALRQAFQQKDLLMESRRLLQVYKRQSVLIRQLEKRHPGMTKLDRTSTGSIIIDDTPEDFDSFFEVLSSEVAKAEERPLEKK